MELLEDSWMTISDYHENKYRNGIPESPRNRLLKRLEAMLDCFMVRGDFRVANIMLNQTKKRTRC